MLVNVRGVSSPRLAINEAQLPFPDRTAATGFIGRLRMGFPAASALTLTASPCPLSQSKGQLCRLHCPFHVSVHKKHTSVACAAKFPGMQHFSDSTKLIAFLKNTKDRLWECIPEPVKQFPWNKAEKIALRELQALGKETLKWSVLAFFACGFLSDILYSISGNKELMIPLGLFAGCIMANLFNEISEEFMSNHTDEGITRKFLGLSCFFVLIKFVAAYLRGNDFLLHTANGGLMQILWNWKMSPKADSENSSREDASTITTSDVEARQFQVGSSQSETTVSASAPPPMDFATSDAALWREALASYEDSLKTLDKPDLASLDDFYRNDLPNLLHKRDPNPYITTDELARLMQWKLTRGKWRPRLLSFVSSLTDAVVREASGKAFASLPDVAKAVSELTVLKGVGPATASAVLAAYAPEVAPFMSDEAMAAVVGDAKDYSLKRYMTFTEKVQAKAKELSTEEDTFTPSDVERALWSSTISTKQRKVSGKGNDDKAPAEKKLKRKRR